MTTLRVTLDTGATVDVLREDVAIKVGVSIEPNSNGYKLIDAQKKEIHIVGTEIFWDSPAQLALGTAHQVSWVSTKEIVQ